MGAKVLAALLMVLALPVVLGLAVAASVGGADGVAAVVVVWVVVGVVLAGAAALLVRIWVPVRQLIRAAGKLADGDYSARVPVDGPVMTRPVLGSFNRMAARLQDADEQRRQLLADVGHELRTPLTVIRGDLEAMIDGVRPIDVARLRLLLGDVHVVERLLDDLHTLSLAESGALVLHREPTDVAQTARDVVAGLGRSAADGQVRLLVDAAADVPPIDVDPVRVREVVSNLVVNALRATPPDGTVTVVVQGDATALIVEVRDTGVGIPGDDVDRVFDRFQKGSDSSGTGLGLTISRDLVEAHGGTIQIADTSPKGTTIRLRLPSVRPGEQAERT